MIGRYRFPAPARRLLPTSFSRPEHAPLHPGRFPSPQFKDEIWPSTPRCINDSHIVSMSPEHTYFGIDYVIDVHDLTWAQQPISWGTTIILILSVPHQPGDMLSRSRLAHDSDQGSTHIMQSSSQPLC